MYKPRYYTNEGLLIHHIDEDKKIDLSSSQRAILAPFEYQLPYMNAVRNAIAGAYTQYVKILKYLLRLPDYGNFKSIINYDSLVLKTDSERFEKLYNDIIN